MIETRKDMVFEFTAPKFKFKEGLDEKGKWLEIGGTALVEGESKNGNVYSFDNLKENNDKDFKWLFGHPMESPEAHIVGKGVLTHEGGLFHEGKIRNTATHPDVVEAVKDGFLGPSIHASAKEVTREGNKYHMKGLSIDGVGLVAFQGVEKASIDYAIAESFDKNEPKESTEDEENKDKTGDEKMPEDEKKEAPEEEQEVQPDKEEPQPAEETVSKKDFEKVQEELTQLKEGGKEKLVEEIKEMNSELKKEDLMKESEEMLELRKTYESKKETKEEAIVEDESEEEEGEEKLEEAKDGSVSLAKESYDAFNQELRDRVR